VSSNHGRQSAFSILTLTITGNRAAEVLGEYGQVEQAGIADQNCQVRAVYIIIVAAEVASQAAKENLPKRVPQRPSSPEMGVRASARTR